MKFSIVVATKRKFDSFQHSIKSAIAQTFHSKEFAIVDDCSEDQEKKVNFLKQFEIDYQFLGNSCSMGFASARNRAIEMASGDWIAILDDDDTWHPKYLEIAAKYLTDSSITRDWSFCLSRSDNIHSYAVDREIPQMIHKLIYQGIGRGSGLIFSKKAIEAVGLFDPKYRIVADRDLMLRLLLAGYAPVEIVGSLIFTDETGGVTRDRTLWQMEALDLLEAFFQMPGSELYAGEKAQAMETWKKRLSPEAPSQI